MTSVMFSVRAPIKTRLEQNTPRRCTAAPSLISAFKVCPCNCSLLRTCYLHRDCFPLPSNTGWLLRTVSDQPRLVAVLSRRNTCHVCRSDLMRPMLAMSQTPAYLRSTCSTTPIWRSAGMQIPVYKQAAACRLRTSCMLPPTRLPGRTQVPACSCTTVSQINSDNKFDRPAERRSSWTSPCRIPGCKLHAPVHKAAPICLSAVHYCVKNDSVNSMTL